MLPQNLLRIGATLALAGIALGLSMGITQNHTLAGAHAHLNLVGFVIPFLTGLYYQASPDAARTRLARVQATAAILGAVVFPVGVATVILEGPRFIPFVACGAVLVMSSVVMLTVILFRHGLPRPAGG